MDVTFVDPETAKVAVELQLADINDLLDGLYDNEDLPEGDARESFQVLRYDLHQQLQILEGQVLMLKILKHKHEDRVAFSTMLERAVGDHQLAMWLAGLTVTNPDITRRNNYETCLCDESAYDSDGANYDSEEYDGDNECDSDSDEFDYDSDCASDRYEQRDMSKELYASAYKCEIADRPPLNDISTVRAGGVKANTKSKILGAKKRAKCCVCMEVVLKKGTLTLTCEPEPHTYCRACLVDLFASALVNTSLFPPQCCKVPLPLETCRAMLPKELIKDFDLKVEELATPNPTYCSNADCSKFIQPKDIKADVASCVYCKDKTCVKCKSSEHEGLCPSDPHVQLLMDMAKRGKWQQCTNCKNMVELEQGCFHMTCTCRHQFCYLCGIVWKKCSCPQWDEDYLTRPLPDVGPAQVPDPGALHPAHPKHNWRRVNGPPCDGCQATYLPFVMHCNCCDTSNCWRCIITASEGG